MRLAKKIFLSAVGLIGLLIVGTSVLLGTNFGLQIVKSSLEKSVAGLAIGKLSGSILHLDVSDLQYQTAGLSVEGSLTWNLNASDLLIGRVELSDIELSNARIRVRTNELNTVQVSAETPTEETQPQSSRLSTPFSIALERLTVKNLEVDIDGHVASVGHFETDAHWQEDRIVIESAKLTDSQFQSAPSTPSNEALGSLLKRTFSESLLPSIPAIELPVDFSLLNFEATNFTAQPNLRVEALRFSLQAKDNRVNIDNLSLHSEKIDVSARAVMDLDARHTVDVSAQINAVVPRESIPIGAVAPVEEPTVEEIENFYDRLKQARAQQLKAAEERRAKRRASVAANSVTQKKTLSREEQRQLNRKMRTRLKQRVERWRESVRGMLPTREPLPPVKVTLNARLQGSLSDALTLTGTIDNIPGVRDGTFSITAVATQPGLPLTADLRASEILLSGATFKAAHVALTGKAVDYAINASTQALYPLDSEHNNLTASVSMQGKGTETKLDLSELTVDSNVGLIRIDGQIGWSRDLLFAASLNLSDIDTTVVMPQSPLKISGGFATWGTRSNGRWQAKLQDLTVLGEFRGHSLALTSAMSSNGKGLIEVPSLYFSLGDNAFDLSGRADVSRDIPELDFKAKIDAPALALFDPVLSGSVTGTMTVTGTTSLPVINTDLIARNIAYSGTTLKRARLSGRMRSRDTVSGNMTLELENLTTQGFSMRKASVQARGSELRHQITIQTEGEPLSIQAKITGLYERMLGNWAGALAEFKVQSDYGPVTLQKPIRLSYVSALKRANVMQGCLTHSDATLCLKNNLQIDLTNRSDLRVLVDLERFDLAFIERHLQERLRTKGIVTAQLDMTLPAGLADLPSGKLNIRANNIFTEYRTQSSDLSVGLDRFDLSVSNTKDSVAARWNMDLTDNGSLSGNLLVKDIFRSRLLEGTLKLTAIDTTLINSFLAPGESAEGEIHGDLRFAGTIEEPLVYGQTGIRNARLDSTKLPFEMLPSDFTVRFSGNSSSLDALLKTPKGEMHLEGSADWRTLGEAKAVVTAKSSNLRMTLPPNAEFDLTTNVKCEASAERVKLSGYVSIPWAKVQVTELPPSAVEVSDDVVRLDRPRSAKKTNGQLIPLESNLFINIGENVRVEAMGLKARLTGKLSVVQNKGSLGLTGQISVPNGNFKAYGQELIVRRGEFHFAGPATNPLINLEAIRNPDNTADGVVAGIRITGSADFPQVSVFTDPAKSDTETLSYLIRGEGLDPSGDSDNTMITSALINLGLSQGSQAFKSLGDAIGISGLGFDTEGVGDSSQLVVSGYVLPGLKVKYGVGIFDSLATLTLRYRVIPKLYIEAVSGVDQALDLLYAFEF